MPRKVRDRILDTRAAREKLKPSGKPYYKSIGPELHLGYRKGGDARKWVVRIYAGSGQYVTETIGHADDLADADGINVLSFWQAQEKARDLLAAESVAAPSRRGYTVADAIASYLEHLSDRPEAQRKARLRLAAYVPEKLAKVEIAKLTAADLTAWLRDMAKRPGRVRTTWDADKHNLRNVDMDDPEVRRQRKSSSNRVLTMLKAALNHAYQNGNAPSDHAWKRVKPFKDADAARIRYLTIAESQRLINAADPEFRLLVQTALMTGARYSELCRLRVEDFNPDSETLHVRTSKSGKPRHVTLADEGAEFVAGLCAGRSGRAPLLGEWKEGDQDRRMKAACERANIDPPITFHGLRHTWASLSVMGGMPLIVVAKNLGHSDTRMVEKHYGHLAPSYIADAIRQHAPRFGIVVGNVKAIR
jgi:integrase